MERYKRNDTSTFDASTETGEKAVDAKRSLTGEVQTNYKLMYLSPAQYSKRAQMVLSRLSLTRYPKSCTGALGVSISLRDSIVYVI